MWHLHPHVRPINEYPFTCSVRIPINPSEIPKQSSTATTRYTASALASRKHRRRPTANISTYRFAHVWCVYISVYLVCIWHSNRFEFLGQSYFEYVWWIAGVGRMWRVATATFTASPRWATMSASLLWFENHTSRRTATNAPVGCNQIDKNLNSIYTTHTPAPQRGEHKTN